MAEIRKTYSVLVTAQYWATIEAEPGEDLSDDEVEEQAIELMYDEPHRLEIQDTRIDDTTADCDECGESCVEDDHECDETEEEAE